MTAHVDQGLRQASSVCGRQNESGSTLTSAGGESYLTVKMPESRLECALVQSDNRPSHSRQNTLRQIGE